MEKARSQQVSDSGEREAMKKYLVIWKRPITVMNMKTRERWIYQTDLVSTTDETKVKDYAAKLNARYGVYEGPSKARRLR